MISKNKQSAQTKKTQNKALSDGVPVGWQEVKLGNLVDDGFCAIKNNLRKPLSSATRSKMQGKYPYYGAAGQIDSINDYKLEGFHLLIAEDGTVTSDGIRPMLQLVSGKFWVSNHAHILQGKTKKDTRLLYYMLNTVNINTYITGAVQPKLSKENLLRIKLDFPPLPEQKAIAEALSSLDDKIDLLHRQNKTLEDTAQALFRKWFIDETDEGWEEKPLGKVMNIAIGRTPPRKEFEWFSKIPTDWKWISIKDMGESGVYIFDTSEYLTQKAIEKFNIPIIPQNTVVLSFKMTVGRVGITTNNMLSNEAIAHFKFTEETPFSTEYLYLYLKTFNFNSLGSTSSIVTSINSTMIKDMLITIPDSQTMGKFKKVSKSIFDKIFFNQSQIRTLENLRDTLLPKLMSGEVRVRF